jgi:anhydro-N-acetylmuramic acid kinase
MSNLYIGLLSGTSMDGIDAAIFDFTDGYTLIASYQHALSDHITERLYDIINKDDHNDPRIKEVDQQLGRCFAKATNQLLQQAKIPASSIKAIGSHGQNISHHPNDIAPYSLQIGDPQIITDLTQITTVANFRTADVAAGGQGAPLAPLLHQQVALKSETKRAIINIGGIANVSFVSDNENVTGFDTGPGNGLMDAWVHLQQQQKFDHAGQWAATGQVDETLLSSLLNDDYFSKASPKSTGKEYFNLSWLQQYLDQQKPRDVQATLCALTARSIIDAIESKWPKCEIIICGGGGHNTYLMERMSALTKNPIVSSDSIGLNADYLEAMLFAWLAKLRLENTLVNTCHITGAKKPVLLGEIFTTHKNQN